MITREARNKIDSDSLPPSCASKNAIGGIASPSETDGHGSVGDCDRISRKGSPGDGDIQKMEPVTVVGPKRVTFKEVRSNPKIRALIEGANEVMKAMGYTEHGHRHLSKSSLASPDTSSSTKKPATPRDRVGADRRLYARHWERDRPQSVTHCTARCDGVHHPQRDGHGRSQKWLRSSEKQSATTRRCTGGAVSVMSAALIIADKSDDVHRSRVQNPILVIASTSTTGSTTRYRKAGSRSNPRRLNHRADPRDRQPARKPP